MPFTPDAGTVNQVTSASPTVTLGITLPSPPPSCNLIGVEVFVNPGQPYSWTGSAPTSSGNFDASGFKATSGSPGTMNSVMIKYKYVNTQTGIPCEQSEGHSFYLYM
jgi:hypothetical protein